MSASAAVETAKVDLVKQYKCVGIRAVLAATTLLKKDGNINEVAKKAKR